MVDDSGAGDTDVDNVVCFSDAMEGSGHERVVIRGIAEDHKLCAAQGILVCGFLGSLLDDPAHELDRIHIDAGLGRAEIHGRAYAVSAGQSLGNGLYQKLFGGCHALCRQS